MDYGVDSHDLQIEKSEKYQPSGGRTGRSRVEMILVKKCDLAKFKKLLNFRRSLANLKIKNETEFKNNFFKLNSST